MKWKPDQETLFNKNLLSQNPNRRGRSHSQTAENFSKLFFSIFGNECESSKYFYCEQNTFIYLFNRPDDGLIPALMAPITDELLDGFED